MEKEELERILEGGAETPQVDFKQSMPWNARSFAKDVLAMSNTIDGGRIIVGVKEEPKGVFAREGILPEHKSTYQVDIMKDQLAKYADPFIELTVSFPKDLKDIEYCIVRIEPFREVPVICRVPDRDHGLIVGGIYHRNRNRRAESALVSNSYDMRDIVERAMLKMRYRAKQIGYELPIATDSELVLKVLNERLKKERGDL